MEDREDAFLMEDKECEFLMEDREDAFLIYALDSNIETIANFWQHCDTQAKLITKLITTMERYGLEDGNLAIPTISEELKAKLIQDGSRLQEIHRAAGGCFVSSQRLKDLGYAEERSKIKKYHLNLHYGILMKVAMRQRGIRMARTQLTELYNLSSRTVNALFDDVNCFPLTREFLLSLYEPSLGQATSSKYDETGMISPIDEWKDRRYSLWGICDFLYDRAELAAPRTVKQSRPGQPRDHATTELIHWASGQGITIDELARMLAERNLDKDRQGNMARMLAEEALDNKGLGSIAARTRKEKKRLLQSERNKDQLRPRKHFPSA